MTTAPLTACSSAAGRRRLRRLVQVVALFHLCLILATWPLWFTPDVFPVVPLTCWAPHSSVLDCTCAVLLLAGLLGAVCRPDVLLRAAAASPKRTLLPAAAVFGTGTLLVLTNQHRLQAWHWFSLICLLQCLILPSGSAVKTLRLTTAGVYVFSALSRVTTEPSTGMPLAILRALASTAGMDPGPISPAIASWLSGILIIGEFLTGLLLCAPAFRRLGVFLALGLHLALLLALGPVGLGHEPAVLIWNGNFLVLVPVMFCGRDSSQDRVDGPRSRGDALVTAIFMLLITGIPLSGLLGIADNWPSWQLYSPRPEVWRLFVRVDVVDQLPAEVRRYTGQPAPLDEWVPVRLDRWSLDATGSPMYPEDRFQLAVMEAVVRGIRDEAAVRVEIDSPEVPRWWRRRRETVFGVSGLRSLRRHFFLNSECR